MLASNLNFFKHICIFLLISVLISCASTNKENVSHLIKAKDAKIFTVVSVDESGNEINNRLILEALQQNISKLSYYPNFYSAIEDLSETVSGFEAIIVNNNIKVQYLNGKLSSSGNHKITKVSATFKIDIKTDNFGLHKTVTVHQPKSLHLAQAREKFGNIGTLDSPDKLKKDVEHIFSKIDLTLERLLFISGEIIVRNSDDEVFDNFEHLLGLYSKNSFQEKDMIFGIFQLKSNIRKDIIPLRVRIFPNDKGSRVKYEFDIKYSINPDGTTSYNDKEINYLVTTIKNISTTKDLDAPVNHEKVNNKNLIAIIDDPVMISNYTKSGPQVDIHKTSITYKPRTTTKNSKKKVTSKKKTSQYKSKKINDKPKIKKLGADQETQKVSKSGDKTSNIKNIEYIEKMLSSLKEKRPSK